MTEEPELESVYFSKEDCLSYLDESTPNGRASYRAYSTSDLRIGQAWYCSLSNEDRHKLVGTLYDPFYKDDWLSVAKALTYLLT